MGMAGGSFSHRGVYIGECSRLAVLCSTKENYIGAIKDLNSLYVMRGYPSQLIAAWCRKNIQERWDKRFALKPDVHDEGVLVLKTRFDDVWNWFSAAELGKSITEYWSEWYTRAEKGEYTNLNLAIPYPPATTDSGDLDPLGLHLCCSVRTRTVQRSSFRTCGR